MGILDSLFSDNPNDAAYLALASGLLSGKGNFNSIVGNSLMGAQNVYSQAKKSQLQDQMAKLQLEEAQRTAEQAKRERAAEDAFTQSIVNMGSPQMRASQAALAGGGGPTASNAAKMPAVDPMQTMMFEALRNRQIKPMQYAQSLQKQAPTFHSITEGGTGILVGPDGRIVNTIKGSPKDDRTSDQKDYMRAVSEGFAGSFIDYQREMANLKAPKTTVSVNTGQKGLENELKLKTDFRQEPIYKDYSEMISAYKQIKAGISQGTPIGDLTTATKIMKLLDPTSVVRESELGMAMAATGRMDRLRNFVDLQIKGQKLTPQQRVEFGQLADELYEAAGQAYNQKRAEYEDIGKRYKLDTTSLGKPHKSISEWSIKRE